MRVVAPDLALNEFLTRISDTNGNEVSTVTVGQPLWVIASARVLGWYQTAELSATSAAFSFADKVSIGSCSQLMYGPPLVTWNWTPQTPGSYSVEFQVRALSGEPDPISADNALTKTLNVVAGPQVSGRFDRR